MKPIADEIAKRSNSYNSINSNNRFTDNSVYKSTVTSYNSSLIENERDSILPDYTAEGMGKKLAEDLSDLKSEDYYIILADNTHHQILFEALAIVNDYKNRGEIRTTKAKLFMGILRKKGVKTKFKKVDSEPY